MNRYFLLGWLIAFVFWLYSISWIFNAINYYGAGTILSGSITFLLVSYLSIYFGIFLSEIPVTDNEAEILDKTALSFRSFFIR